jgi:hypothetical protein
VEDTVDPTEYQKQVMYGAILGDGRLERPKQGNSRLQIRHSIRQEPYVVYKHEILKPLSLNLLSYTYFDSRTGRKYKQEKFALIREFLEEYYKQKEKELYEVSLIERIIRVEEELKNLRKEMEYLRKEMEYRFEALLREMNARFEAITKEMNTRFEVQKRESDARFEALLAEQRGQS